MTDTNSFRRILFQPLLWALLYGGLIAYGIYAYVNIPVEVLPAFNFPEISVIAHEPGATATELETGITRPIEGELLALPNLDSVRSSMGSGTVEIDTRFHQGTNPTQDLMAVNSAIDHVRSQMPASVQPLAQIMGNGINEVADYSLQIPPEDSPAAIEQTLKAEVIPQLRALPGVYQAQVYGAGQEALWVQPDISAMRRYGIPVTAIVAALRQHILLKPGGRFHRSPQPSHAHLQS